MAYSGRPLLRRSPLLSQLNSMITPLSPYNLDSIADVDEALLLIQINLDDLITMCGSGPIVLEKDKQAMVDNIAFVKHYYEKAERLLCDTKS